MKSRHLLAAGALLIALVASLPAPAGATKNGHVDKPRVVKNVGQIDGDNATKVTLRVVIHGANAEVERFKARNVLVNCDDGPSRIAAFTALKPITVGPKGGFGVKLDDVATGGVLRINGVVGKGGESTTGSLKTNSFPSGDQTCKSPKQTFSTSAIG